MGTANQDGYLRIKGFKVAISGENGDGKTVDSNWRRVTGGASVVEVAETTVGGENFKTFAPGHAHVTPLVLEGCVTGARKGMLDWLNNTATGKEPRKMVTIIPIKIDGSDSKQHIYHDCLIEEYNFPELHAEAHNELAERVVIRPERYEIK